MGGINSGRGMWLPEKLAMEQEQMRLRHDKKIRKLLEAALVKMERDERIVSRLLPASRSSRLVGSARSQKPDAPSC
jgi:hypothetical protein